MARPAKAVSSKTSHITKEESIIRTNTESALKGDAKKLTPPKYLTPHQKRIFRYIVRNLEESGILGNLDLYILSVSAVTISNLIELDEMINEEQNREKKLSLMATRDKYTKDFFRCCNELSLSPQARAKISISAVKSAQESRNPLLEALDL